VKDTDLAWAAGFIDGEGCFTVHLHTSGILSAVLSADNTKIAPIQALKEMFGGKVTLSRKATERTAAAYRWQVNGHTAATVSVLVLPFLRVKQEQAAIIAQFGALTGIQGRAVPLENLQRRVALKAQIEVLNRRGA
jgi:hypothetical protein